MAQKAQAKEQKKQLTKRQKDFLEIFGNKLGLVYQSCADAKLPPRTYYNWMKQPEFSEAVEDVKTRLKDFGEGALFSLIKKGNPRAVVFFNKTKNKDRGYVERIETEEVGEVRDQKMELTIINSPEDLKKLENSNDMSAGDKPENKILIVDIETTNFLQRGGLIVEIGIVSVNLENGNVEVLYDEKVKEEGLTKEHADSWIFNNSDLKIDDCLNAKPLDLKKISELLANNRVTSYNTEFDFGFLRDRGVIINELPCLMKISKDVCKIPMKSGEGIKMPSFQEAWNKIVGEEYEEKHRGVDDAIHEARVAFELYKTGDFKC